MSHQVAIVAIPKRREHDYEQYIAEALEPYYYDGADHPHLYWDSYVIGGRWDGYYFDGQNIGVPAALDRMYEVWTYIDESGNPHSVETYSSDEGFVQCPDFDNEYLAFLNRLPADAMLVVVDYHN